MTGIEEMFAEFGSVDEYDGQYCLERWVRTQRESTAAADEARRHTQHRITYLREWRANNARKKREHDRKYREKNREKLRAYWRARDKAKREMRRAA